MTERQSTAQPFYSKNTMCGKQLYSALIELLHLVIKNFRFKISDLRFVCER